MSDLYGNWNGFILINCDVMNRLRLAMQDYLRFYRIRFDGKSDLFMKGVRHTVFLQNKFTWKIRHKMRNHLFSMKSNISSSFSIQAINVGSLFIRME